MAQIANGMSQAELVIRSGDDSFSSAKESNNRQPFGCTETFFNSQYGAETSPYNFAYGRDKTNIFYSGNQYASARAAQQDSELFDFMPFLDDDMVNVDFHSAPLLSAPPLSVSTDREYSEQVQKEVQEQHTSSLSSFSSMSTMSALSDSLNRRERKMKRKHSLELDYCYGEEGFNTDEYDAEYKPKTNKSSRSTSGSSVTIEALDSSAVDLALDVTDELSPSFSAYSLTETSNRGRAKWAKEDSLLLWKGIFDHGNEWREIRKSFPDRSYDQVKDKGRRMLRQQRWTTGRTKDVVGNASDRAKYIARQVLSEINRAALL